MCGHTSLKWLLRNSSNGTVTILLILRKITKLGCVPWSKFESLLHVFPTTWWAIFPRWSPCSSHCCCPPLETDQNHWSSPEIHTHRSCTANYCHQTENNLSAYKLIIFKKRFDTRQWFQLMWEEKNSSYCTYITHFDKPFIHHILLIYFLNPQVCQNKIQITHYQRRSSLYHILTVQQNYFSF